MEHQRIVITGVGVVAPNGIGKEEFWANCFAGVSGIKPITLFDVSKYRCRYAGEVSNFQPEKPLGPKGLRNLDRTTLLALVAAKQAIDDAQLEITDENRNEIGVVLGSTMGSVHSISEFDKEGLREGPRYVNPALFPNTVINSPASQVAIRFGLKGLNTTIATGFTASLDAIGYAVDMLRLGRAKRLLVGGVEELCVQTYLGFEKLGLLARLENGLPSAGIALQDQPTGMILGEGAAFFVLQNLEDIDVPEDQIYGEILGYGTRFDPHPGHRFTFNEGAIIQAVREALRETQLPPGAIDFMPLFGHGTGLFDRAESKVLETVFDESDRISRLWLKALIGESFSADGAMRLALTLGVLSQQQLPQQVTFPASSVSNPLTHALIVGHSPMGASSATVVSRWQESTVKKDEQEVLTHVAIAH